jgi:hypothetical protein
MEFRPSLHVERDGDKLSRIVKTPPRPDDDVDASDILYRLGLADMVKPVREALKADVFEKSKKGNNAHG